MDAGLPAPAASAARLAPSSADLAEQGGEPLIGAQQARTLPGLLQARVTRSPDRRAYMTCDPGPGAWRALTWREFGERAGRYRRALKAAGLARGERVAVLLPNGVDWAAFDMAALSLGLVVVPLYLRDGVRNQARVLAHSGARLLLVDTPERWAAIAGAEARPPAMDQVWIRDAPAGTSPPPARRLGEVLPATGAWTGQIEARPDDLATVIYTSGTTGAPKGVMLTHAAILWNAEAVTTLVAPSAADLFLSVLPLAHAFERTVGYYLPMMAGATVAYAGSVETLARDLVAVRPTILLAVPELYERAYAELERRAARWPFGAQLLRAAAEAGWRDIQRARGSGPAAPVPERLAGPLLRRLVGARLPAAFGGRLRVAVSGGARLPEAVARRLAGLGLPLVEGYGLTEAGPVVSGTSPEDYLPGSAGRPLPGADLRLSEAGELLVRSPGLMRGYWRDAQATATAFQDGWLRTGDVAEIQGGRLFLRGRVNDIVVLATGEKFDPDPVEAAILSDPLFDQACVLGQDRPFAVGVVVLSPARWANLAGRLGLDPQWPNSEAAKAVILQRVARALAAFPRFAQVRNLHVASARWTTEAGLLTPTLKVKRYAVAANHAQAIADLYGPHPVFD